MSFFWAMPHTTPSESQSGQLAPIGKPINYGAKSCGECNTSCKLVWCKRSPLEFALKVPLAASQVNFSEYDVHFKMNPLLDSEKMGTSVQEAFVRGFRLKNVPIVSLSRGKWKDTNRYVMLWLSCYSLLGWFSKGSQKPNHPDSKSVWVCPVEGTPFWLVLKGWQKEPTQKLRSPAKALTRND